MDPHTCTHTHTQSNTHIHEHTHVPTSLIHTNNHTHTVYCRLTAPRDRSSGSCWSWRSSQPRRDLMSASGSADRRRDQQVPDLRPHRCPSRTMAYSVNKDLDHRMEYFRELSSKKSGHYDRGRARTQEPSDYEKTDKMT